MLIKEYRIPLPLTVEEYRIAQLYMIQVSDQSCLLTLGPADCFCSLCRKRAEKRVLVRGVESRLESTSLTQMAQVATGSTPTKFFT